MNNNINTVELGNEIIYITQHDKDEEERVTTIDNNILRDTLSDKLRLNGGGRILKVQVTMSHNVYNHKDELNQTITFLPKEDK
tara:strand:- start:789 stop:1037 length:249 start_codon:yes stop_codon:yes gene_type:complete